MPLIQIIISLLAINSIAHSIQFFILIKQKASDKSTVFAFALINSVLALLIMKGYVWDSRVGLAVLLIGFLGLAFQVKKATSSNWVNYLIFMLDLIIVGVIAYLFFY